MLPWDEICLFGIEFNDLGSRNMRQSRSFVQQIEHITVYSSQDYQYSPRVQIQSPLPAHNLN